MCPSRLDDLAPVACFYLQLLKSAFCHIDIIRFDLDPDEVSSQSAGNHGGGAAAHEWIENNAGFVSSPTIAADK